MSAKQRNATVAFPRRPIPIPLMGALVLCMLAGCWRTGWAAGWYPITPEEAQFCRIEIYGSLSGTENLNPHHYCDCLRSLNRAMLEIGHPSDKSYYAGVAIDSCKYYLSHTPKDDWLRAGAHLHIGLAMQVQGDKIGSLKELYRALQLDPKMVKAYTAISDLYADIGEKGKALEIVTEGLRRQPDARPLLRRYQKLGGKQPYPEPYPEPTASGSPPSTPPAVKTPKGNAANGVTPPRSSPPSAPAPQPAPTSTTGGTPTNPWCRFCP